MRHRIEEARTPEETEATYDRIKNAVTATGRSFVCSADVPPYPSLRWLQYKTGNGARLFNVYEQTGQIGRNGPFKGAIIVTADGQVIGLWFNDTEIGGLIREVLGLVSVAIGYQLWGNPAPGAMEWLTEKVPDWSDYTNTRTDVDRLDNTDIQARP